MTDDYYQRAPEEEIKRRLALGHSLTRPEALAGSLSGLYQIKCKCGWFTVFKLADKEAFEHKAWQHITKPMYLVSGSSDTLLPMRLKTLRDVEQSRTDRS